MVQIVAEVKDLYLRKPPFSFNAIKVGDIAFFSNGKALVIEEKIKPDNKGQSWYGLRLAGYSYVYDNGTDFDTSGKCSNGSGMDITHILKVK